MPSSVIRRFWYRERVLGIEFVSGRRYRYLDVPEPVYDEMRRSASKGEFFNTHIRDKFVFERVRFSGQDG
jgi:hypothetical protein